MNCAAILLSKVVLTCKQDDEINFNDVWNYRNFKTASRLPSYTKQEVVSSSARTLRELK